MKSKKIVALICAVAILSISGICIANAATQTKERGMEYACDVADPNYKETLTAEQQMFNKLINKQIYEETADNLKVYETYGLSYNAEENQLYFSEIPVCYFADNYSTDGTFEGTEVRSANGNIGIVTERDKNGALVALKQLNTQELSEFLAKGWRK